MKSLPQTLLRLSEHFARLPGIGAKTAQRLAYHVINLPKCDVEAFARDMLSAYESTRLCSVCKCISETDVCEICADDRRDHNTICVTEFPKDVFAIERSGNYSGVYHVLHGLLSPMGGTGPGDIFVRELVARIGSSGASGTASTTSADSAVSPASAESAKPAEPGSGMEIIIATGPTNEGEVTASYIAQLLRHLDVKVTRIAYGMPMGSSIEYVDDVTLSKAIENRVLM
ncbi:recombination protein RecR [Clostridia bacterium]|nr:recombination protein RecR [Clostridia bacterium]